MLANFVVHGAYIRLTHRWPSSCAAILPGSTEFIGLAWPCARLNPLNLLHNVRRNDVDDERKNQGKRKREERTKKKKKRASERKKEETN